MRAFCAVLLALFLTAGSGFGHAGANAEAGALPHTSVTIETARGPVRFTVEVATDKTSQERGLMFRKHLPANAGMLFDFHKPVTVNFWMKNTVLPLDIIFIRADGTISTIHARAVPHSEIDMPSAEPVRAVLEINGGLAEALGIEPGDRVRNPIFANAR